MPKFLITSDLHLTDRAQDEYRWAIFKTLRIQGKTLGVEAIMILGDLTHEKDRHSSVLVNRLVDEMEQLADVANLHILKGNHDYVDEQLPFFKFLRDSNRIRYYSEPSGWAISSGVTVCFLPHSRDPDKDWTDEVRKELKRSTYTFFHQAIAGASSNGHKLSGGISAKVFDSPMMAIGGDIHEPQQIGKAIYCGSPHPVNFGDDFEPRILYIDGKKLKSIPVTTIKKVHITARTLDDIDDAKVGENDQVKVTFQLKRADFPSWEGIRKEAAAALSKKGCLLCGMELKEKVRQRIDDDAEQVHAAVPSEVFTEFCRQYKVEPSLKEYGLELMKTSQEVERVDSGRVFRFESLSLQGFRSFRSSQTFHFGTEPAFVMFLGKNKVHPRLGPNATGKSSFWDGLCWVLTGKTARGLRAKDVVNWAGEEKCVCSLAFTTSGRGYTLCRKQSPNALTLMEDASEGDPVNITQEDLEKFLGFDHGTFTNAALMGQFNSFFFDLSPAEKMTQFALILNLDRWTNLAKREAETGRLANAKLIALDRDLERYKGEIDQLKLRRDELDGQSKQWKLDAAEQLKKLDEELEVAERVFTKANDLYEETRDENKQSWEQRRELEEKLVEADKRLREREREHEKLTSLIADLEKDSTRWRTELERLKKAKTCPTCGQKVVGSDVADSLEQTQVRLSNNQTIIANQTTQLESLVRSVDNARQDRKEANTRLTLHDQEMEKAKKKESDARVSLGEHKTKLAYAEAALAQFKKQGNPHEKSLESIESLLERKRNERNAGREEKEKILTQVNAAEFWTGKFKDLRLWLVEQSLRELEIDVNNSLVEIGLIDWAVKFDIERENASGGISKGFTTLIKSPANTDLVPWEAWCGGETQRLRVAGAIGLSNLICRRRGLDFGFEIWDEPSAHISESGVDDLMNFFQARSQGEKKQVYIIEHRSTDYGGFDRRVTIVKDHEGSRIEE